MLKNTMEKDINTSVNSGMYAAQSMPVVENASNLKSLTPVTSEMVDFNYSTNTMPYNPVVSGKSKKKGNSVAMLVMAFLTFIFMTVLPMFSVPDVDGLSLYSADLTRISMIGMELSDIDDGDITQHFTELFDELIATAEDPVEQMSMKAISEPLLEKIAETEPQIVNGIEKVGLYCILLFAACILVLAMVIVNIFASIKGWRILYLITNIVNLCIFAALIIACAVGLGIEYVSYGLWGVLIMNIASSIVAMVKKA